MVHTMSGENKQPLRAPRKLVQLKTHRNAKSLSLAKDTCLPDVVKDVLIIDKTSSSTIRQDLVIAP